MWPGAGATGSISESLRPGQREGHPGCFGNVREGNPLEKFWTSQKPVEVVKPKAFPLQESQNVEEAFLLMARELMSRNGLHVQRGNPESDGAPGILLRENTRSVDLNAAAYTPVAPEKKSCCWCWRTDDWGVDIRDESEGLFIYCKLWGRGLKRRLKTTLKPEELQKSAKEYWQICTFLRHVWWSIKVLWSVFKDLN